MKKLMKVLLLLCTLMAGMESATAQTTFTKWKQVQDPSTLGTDDVVVIVDLTSSNAMRNNLKYDEGSTVSNESPGSTKVTLKEEQDRITSEVADTIIWTADRADDKYAFYFLNEDNKTRYLFDSDQNLRVGFVSNDNASKKKFDLDKGLLHRKIETDEDTYKNFYVGLKVASGIQAMMGGNTWELLAETDGGEVNSDIAATKMAFFKKVETTLPDPTLHFPGHDYEADLKDGTFTSPAAVVDEDPNAQITYWSGNENLAELDSKTGVVTLKKRGTVRIYAQVKATESYDNYLTSYVLRIDDTTNNVKGCRTNPFTVAEAREYAKGDHAEETADGVCYFVSGIVSSVGGGMDGMEDMMEMMSGMMGGGSEEGEGTGGFDMSAMLKMFLGEQEPGTVTYAISDNGVNCDSLSIINGRGLLIENILSDITKDSLSVGDWVTVYGPLEYSEDNDMMSSFGGDKKEKKPKMPRVNYMSYHKRNLITKDIILYYNQEKKSTDLFSITDLFGGTLVTKQNAKDTSKPFASLIPSDKEIADWVVSGTGETEDSVLVPKMEGIITITVKAPVLLNTTLEKGDTVYMERSFTLDVRDRELQPAGTMVGNYELVTHESQLNEGDKLIVVATIDNKPKVLVRSSGSSGGIMDMFGGSSNAQDVTIESDGSIRELPDVSVILTLEKAGDKWLLQTGKRPDGKMTYLYISDPENSSSSMIPGMGSSGAKLKTGVLEDESANYVAGDSCKVSFSFPENKNDSVKMQFNFQDRGEGENKVTAKNVIRYEKAMMSTSFGGFEPESDKATLPRLYRLIQDDKYTITVSDALWATIVSSYDVTLPEGLTGYVVHEIDNEKNEAVLHDVTEQGGLKGGKPYLLNATEAGTYTLTKASDETTITEPEVNLLKISDNETGNGVYVLANKGYGAAFYKWTGGLLGAGRVYLEKPNNSTAPKYYSFSFDNDGTTGIATMSDGKGTRSDVWYDLQGRRVDQGQRSTLNGQSLKKGIYIVNGSKVVIK